MCILDAIHDRRPLRLILGGIAVMALGAAAADAWFNAFSTFVGYDDEGYFLMTTRFFLEGWPLYDDVPAFYGPAYYALRALLHGPLRLPNTNEAARYGLIVLWLATAALSGLFTAREVRQPWLGIVAFLLAFNFLRSGLSNPGHPEMLVAALLAVLPLVAGGEAVPSWRRLALLGALCAIVTLTKINAGVLAALAVLVAASVPTMPPVRSPWAILLAAATALLPPLLMRSSPGRPDLLTYTALVSGSFAMAWIFATRTVVPDAMTSRAGLAAFVAGGLVTVALLLGWLASTGSTLTGLVRSTVVIPQRLSGVFHSWPPWTPVPPYVFGLLIAAVAWCGARRPGATMLIALRFALFAVVIVQERFWTQFFPGRNINLVFNVAPYLAWVVLVPTADRAAAGPSFGRRVLVFLACLQLLLAYPIPGSQVLFGSVWLVPLGVIALGDALRELAFPPERRTPHPRPLPAAGERGPDLALSPSAGRGRAAHRPGEGPSAVGRGWRAAAPVVVVALLVLWLVPREARQARAAWIAYRSPGRLPLGLPGTGPLRLPEARVATYRWLATNLRAYADRSLSTVGSPSLHAWSGVDPPSHLVIPNSLRVLDETQSHALLEAIDRFPRFVLLRRSHSFLSPRLDDTAGSLPILDELDRRFLTLAELDGWQFQVRRERPGTGGLLDGWGPDGPRRFAATIAPRPRAPIGRFVLRDAETGREFGPLAVRDEAGGEPSFDPDRPRRWSFEADRATIDALRSATYPVVRVEGIDGRWLASLPFPRRIAIVD